MNKPPAGRTARPNAIVHGPGKALTGRLRYARAIRPAPIRRCCLTVDKASGHDAPPQMPFSSKKFGFAYFPIPKVGGTSIRDVLFSLEAGHRFVPTMLPSGASSELWMHFPAIAFHDIPHRAFDGFDRFVVVRAPLERLVSAYRNRVRHYREIELADFARAGIDRSIPKHPDFDTFCRFLLHYRKIDVIRHHTQPQVHYLGPDLSYFSKVFQLERIAELEAYLSDRAGRKVVLPRLRSDGPSRSDISISDASRRAISAYYAEDFALLKNIYARD